jgi:ABC-type lipoprotein export system ATPase subunit
VLALSPKELSTTRSVLLQRNDFILAFTVQEILELVAYQAAKGSKVRSLKSLAKELDLLHLLSRSVLELSGGERQRVSLAITLTREVPLYLLDEPLSAQDEEHSQAIALYLSKLALSGSIMVIATHDTAELSAVASQEIRLRHS